MYKSINPHPKVSIIMPTYNRSEFLYATVQSILHQTYGDFELIIIDDCSTDNTANMLAQLAKEDSRIKSFKNEKNLKVVRTLNKGIREAKGIYIARADDDDLWIDPKKLETQVSFLEKNPDYVLVGTGAIVVNEEGKETFKYFQPISDSQIRRYALLGSPFIHPSVVFKKSVLEKTGLYDEQLSDSEDWDLWLKMGNYGKIYNIPRASIERFYGERGLSVKNRRNIGKTRLHIIRKHRHNYPNFILAIIFNGFQRVYTFLPYHKKLDNFLFKLKRKSLEG